MDQRTNASETPKRDALIAAMKAAASYGTDLLDGDVVTVCVSGWQVSASVADIRSGPDAVYAKAMRGSSTPAKAAEQPSHHQRVVDERNQLAERLAALQDFLWQRKDEFPQLHAIERNRLIHQSALMTELVEVMNERIKGFAGYEVF